MTTPFTSPTTFDAQTPGQIRQLWADRIDQARQAKLPFLPGFLSDLAFASGQHWLVWDRRHRRMRNIGRVDSRYAGKELYIVNRIREYREAQLGELQMDSDRPTILSIRNDDTSERAIEALNQAVDYSWEHEWEAESVLRRARAYCVDMGVAAIRCRWEKDAGKVIGHHPFDQNGQPVQDQNSLAELHSTGTIGGRLPEMRPVKEGRTSWEPYSALQILPPPGVNHERDFPWEILARPCLVTDVQETYGDAAQGLSEDPDIANAMGLSLGYEAVSGQTVLNRIRDHVWVFTCYQRPSHRYPQGRYAILASNQFKLLDYADQLPYTLPNGEPHSGVVYLHWWRSSDRFWSQSFVGSMKDPQRLINRVKTQQIEITDRGLPKVYIKEGDLPETPTGAPMEIVKLNQNASPPVMFNGIGPGPWMDQELAGYYDDLAHASTMSSLKLGENPPGVDTYSQLALLNDNEMIKRTVTLLEHRAMIGRLLELSVDDMKKYWPQQKQILVMGDDEQIDAVMFDKTKIPTWFMAKIATGAPQPRNQGAELKKVDAIWGAAVQSWAAVNDSQTWVEWYANSLHAGKPLAMPEAPKDSQQEYARLENLLMRQGVQPQVMDYDLLPVHLPEHREAEDAARASNDVATLARIIQHINDHVKMSQQQAAQVAAAQGAPAAPENALGLKGPMSASQEARVPGEFQEMSGGASGTGMAGPLNP